MVSKTTKREEPYTDDYMACSFSDIRKESGNISYTTNIFYCWTEDYIIWHCV